MQKNLRLLAFALLLPLLPALLPAPARAGVSVSFFYEALDPYGWWVDLPDYGYCWRPRVSAGWHPYAEGSWAYTDYGWTWVSQEDFGWAVYHYGRWIEVEEEGWCWVPDTEWGPAWVSWRWSDDYVGWAPLPPAARFRASVGFNAWVDRDYDIGPSWFNFCSIGSFGATTLRPVIINRTYNTTIIHRTTNITRITVRENRICNDGPDYREIKRRSKEPVKTLKLVREEHRDPKAKTKSRVDRDQLALPVVSASVTGEPPEKPRAVKKLKKAKTDTGWAGVKSREEREALQKTMASAEGSPAERPAPAPETARKPQKTDAGEGVAGFAREERSKKSPGANQAGPVEEKGLLQPFLKDRNAESEARQERLAEKQRERLLEKSERSSSDGRMKSVAEPQAIPGGSGPDEAAAARVAERNRQAAIRQKMESDAAARALEQSRARDAEARRQALEASRLERERERESEGRQAAMRDGQTRELATARAAESERLRERQREAARERSEMLRQRQQEAAQEERAETSQARQMEVARERQQEAQRQRSEALRERQGQIKSQQAERSAALQERSRALKEQQQANREAQRARLEANKAKRGKSSGEETGEEEE